MPLERKIVGLAQEPNGTWTGSYGPYTLRSGYQPIFSQNSDGLLALEAFEGLIRPVRGDEPVSPGQFFSHVEPDHGPQIDSLCRTLHIKNLATVQRPNILLFLNFNPEYLSDDENTERELLRIASGAREAGIRPSQIVCEITEQGVDDPQKLEGLVEKLRARRFQIAIDDYGAEDSDAERLSVIKPNIIKFDAMWVRRFMENPAGFALLKSMVQRFQDDGITTLFEGLEDHWQVEACQELGVRLLQGYALARPQVAPTTFNIQFPPAPEETGKPASRPEVTRKLASVESETEPAPPVAMSPHAEYRPVRPARRVAFGRRGA